MESEDVETEETETERIQRTVGAALRTWGQEHAVVQIAGWIHSLYEQNRKLEKQRDEARDQAQSFLGWIRGWGKMSDETLDTVLGRLPWLKRPGPY